jgi:hypothetical protein
MNALKDDANEYIEDNERIRVYLKIKPSNPSDKIFYNVSKDKKILSLLDNIALDDHKKTKKVEIDKIFTNKDENSYIYEEVMLNCVKNSLNGENFTFISYGDSSSEKHQLIIGTPDCYENINHRGLFPRLLENYINKIDSNEILSDSISLSLSYIMINNNNMIDLTQLMGLESKVLEKITKEELIRKYSKEMKIEHNVNLLKTVKKTPVETANDPLFFLLQILNLLYKLDSSNHFLTWSYFIIIMYVTDNDGKTVSTINFIILPGNELLLQRALKRKSFLNIDKRDSVGLTIKNNANEFFYTIEDIYAFLDIKSLQTEDDNKKTKEENKNKNEKNKKNEIKSKLFNLIGNLSFDINNKEAQYYRKYIIVGSIFGNSGYITYIKDTLYFLSQCKKFSGQKISNKNHNNNFDYTFFSEKLKAKNDQIYDLESKLKTQETKVNELNLLMDSKEANLKALQENYKEQIKSLKDELGFKGDINNLLKQNVNSEEYEFTLKIRNTTENNKLKNLKIDELKQQISQIETVIQQLRTLLSIKENDATMLDIVRSVRETQERKREEMEVRNTAGAKIEDLRKKNLMLENKIKGYKNEICLKKKILNGLPEIFGKNMNIKKNMNNLEIKLNENDNSMKWFVNNNKEEINRIKTDANNEKKIIIDKYENILVQNKNSIKDIGNKLDNILIDFQNEKKSYLNELVFLYKHIINIINCYKKVFLSNCSVFVNKEKFDKIIIKEEKDINPLTFPLLYHELGKIGYGHFQLNNKKSRPKKKEIKSKYYKNITEDIKIDDDDENNKKEKSHVNYMKKSQRDKKIYKIIDIVKNEINNENSVYKNMLPISNDIIEKKTQIFSSIQRKTDGQLITMSKADLKYFCNSNTEKIEEIEKFIHNYFEIEGNVDNFDPAKERIDEIKKKLKIINNKIKELSNKYINNNKRFEDGDKIIQKLRNENHLLRKKIYDKDMRNIYSNFSPTVQNNRTQKMSFNKTNNLFKLNAYNNNYYNSILTTTSSNEGYNQLIKPNSTRLFSDINSTGGTNEKTEKIYNLTDNNFEYFKKRPISSINKINPYFLVAENI